MRRGPLTLAGTAVTAVSVVAALVAAPLAGAQAPEPTTTPTPNAGPARADPAWPMVQGGPAHPGKAPARAPEPPYRTSWDVDAGRSGNRGATGPVIVGDVAIAVGREEVVAVAVTDGAPEWAVARAPGFPVTPAVTGGGAMIVYPEGTGEARALIALRLSDRAVAWRFVPSDEIRAAPTVVGDTVYVASRDGAVSAIDAADGRVLWTHQLGAIVRTPLAVADGRVFAVSVDDVQFRMTVHALDADDGDESWRFRPDRAGLFTTGATVGDGRVYVGFGDGSLRALDVRDGRELWSRTVALNQGFGPASLPALLDEDVVVASTSGTVARLDGATGAVVWRHRYPAAFYHGSPLVVGTAVVAGRFDGVAVALDGDSGRSIWRLDLGGGPIGNLAAAPGIVVAGLPEPSGGLVALVHDEDGTLTSIPSPTILRPGAAALNYAIAFAAVTGGLLLGGRLIARRRGAPDAQVPASEGYR